MNIVRAAGFLLVLLVASCSKMGAAASNPITGIPATETLFPQAIARQNDVTAVWESGPHGRAEEPVACDACHEVREGLVMEETRWEDLQVSRIDPVTGRSSLCGRCHDESQEGSAHLGFDCTSCHDPHTVRASCTDSECHAGKQTVWYAIPPTPTDGHPKTGSSFCGGPNCHPAATAVADAAISVHGSDHANVSCLACHNGSDAIAGPSADGNAWILWQVGEDGQASRTASSHSVRLEVDCATCHFENNPWGLGLVSESEYID